MQDVSFDSLTIVLGIAFVVPLLLACVPRLRIPAVVVEIALGIVVGPASARLGPGRRRGGRPVGDRPRLPAVPLWPRSRSRPAPRSVLSLAALSFGLSLVLALGVGLVLDAAGLVRSPLLAGVILTATSSGAGAPHAAGRLARRRAAAAPAASPRGPRRRTSRSARRATAAGSSARGADAVERTRSSTCWRSANASSARWPQTKLTRVPPLYFSVPVTSTTPTAAVLRGWVPPQGWRSSFDLHQPDALPASSGAWVPRRRASSRSTVRVRTGRASQTIALCSAHGLRDGGLAHGAVEVDGGGLRAQVEADGAGLGDLDERPRQEVLPVVLLRVVATALRIHTAAYAVGGHRRLQHVDDDTRRVLHVDDAHPVDGALIAGLAAALRVERGAVEHHHRAAPEVAPLHDGGLELQQVRDRRGRGERSRLPERSHGLGVLEAGAGVEEDDGVVGAQVARTP